MARRDDSPERIFEASFAEARGLTPGSVDDWPFLGAAEARAAADIASA